MPSCRFKHMEGDSMDGQVLRNAGIINADAIIIGNAHDADPKDVSHLSCSPKLYFKPFMWCMQLLVHASCSKLALKTLTVMFRVLLFVCCWLCTAVPTMVWAGG